MRTVQEAAKHVIGMPTVSQACVHATPSSQPLDVGCQGCLFVTSHLLLGFPVFAAHLSRLQEQALTEKELQARFSASLLPKTLVFTQEELMNVLQVTLK